jgi:hypothetical protein
VRLDVGDVADVLDVADDDRADHPGRVGDQIVGEGVEAVDLVVAGPTRGSTSTHLFIRWWTIHFHSATNWKII